MKIYPKDISLALQNCLKQIPFLEITLIQPKQDLAEFSADLWIQGLPHRLLFRFQNSGQPRWAQLAV